MQIKAQGLLNAAKWIEEEYGRDALGTVIRACSEPVRERYVSAIAINWHPMEEFVEFVEIADRMLGLGNGKLGEEIGAAGARANMKGVVVRIAFYLAQPEFFFRRVAGLWHQFNDEGEMLVHHLDDRSGSIEVRGISKPHVIFCGILTGWTRQIATSIGIPKPAVRHTECRARAGARCFWEVRWSAVGDDAKGTRAGHESIARLPTRRSAPPPSSGQLPVPPSSGTTPTSGRFPTAAPTPSSKKPRDGK